MASQNSNTQPTPPSSTSSNNGASPDGQQFRVVRKRNRIPLSCAPCRHRKLKCNRQHPCDNCSKRGDIAACNYATPGNRKRGGANGPNGTPDDMQNRIDRLEGLVLSLMTSGGQGGSTAAAQAAISESRSNSLSTGSEYPVGSNELETQDSGDYMDGEDSEVDQVSKGIGVMKVIDNGRAVYASDSHWYSVLADIREVRKYFETHKAEYEQQIKAVQAAKAHESPGTAFLLQGPSAKNKDELLDAFPSKADADRLIARYFNAYDPSVHIIHGPSFQKEYDRHWQQPKDSSVIWLGLCFAMMTLALQSYHRAGDEPPEYRGKSMELGHDFRRLTAQCLLLGDITQPIGQILETLVLHVQAEYGRSRDAEPGVLLMVSLCVRLAMRMGYHRDPGPHANITPFQGEMRRRVFTFVRQCDLLISFQFGLPAMMRTDHIDTQSPRNLYDDELQEDMRQLPVSRPNFEATPMSYMIAKSKMTFIFGRIVERVGSITNPPTYEETMAFDQELREARGTHPPLLRMRTFQESARDPANLIMQRLGLEMVYLRSLFVLHRSFIAKGRENPRYAYSRKTCIDASLELLSHQATLHQESQPSGRLRSVKWYISSLTTHDFLLAAMLVCLDLYHTAEAERKGKKISSPSDSMNDDTYQEDRRQEMFNAVEHCITIWDAVRGESMEAFKASATLKVIVEKLKAHQQQQQLMQQLPEAQREAAERLRSFPGAGHPSFGMFPNGKAPTMNGSDDMAPEESAAAMTLGMMSSGGTTPSANWGLIGQMGSAEKQSYPAGMAGLLNEPLPERTGLTPNYSGPDTSGIGGQGMTGAASPFSTMLGQGGNFMGMDGLGGDIDWGAWDNYIANNTALDPGNLWPMNLDLDSMGTPGAGQNQQTANSGSVFMGATTPGNTTGMM